MLPTFIAIIAFCAMIVIWIIQTLRKLVLLDENISNAMSQIGIQLSDYMDAIMALLNMAKDFDEQEREMLIEIIKSKRSAVMSNSTPEDVLCQEMIISEVLCRIIMATEQHPQLKADLRYIKTLEEVRTMESKIRTSHLIYNNSVTRLNRKIRMFPVSMIARILCFRKREYLVDND